MINVFISTKTNISFKPSKVQKPLPYSLWISCEWIKSDYFILCRGYFIKLVHICFM